jgi:hypothetical protein
MLLGSGSQIVKGFFRDLALLAFISFDEPFEKDFLVSDEGSRGLLRDLKCIGKLLMPLLKDVDQLVSRTTSGNLQEVNQTICNLSLIIGNT